MESAPDQCFSIQSLGGGGLATPQFHFPTGRGVASFPSVMKRPFRFLSLWLVLPLLVTLLLPSAAAAPAPADNSQAKFVADASPGIRAAQTLSEVTGIAISPLLGVGGIGAIKYLRASEAERAHLSWYAQPWFWVPALLIVGLCLLKDSAGTVLPTSLKKPLDVLELFENKISALVATGAIVPLVMEVFQAARPEAALHAPGFSTMSFAAVDVSWMGNLLLVPLALLAYGVVWVVSHSVNVLILISPFSTVDALLKSFRAALLASVVGMHWINDYAGAIWAGIIVLLCLPLAGWALRLAVFGHLFAWDLLTLRRKRFTPETSAPAGQGGQWAFSARDWKVLPARTYGRVARNAAGELVFHYRPLLVLPPKVATLPAGRYAIGRGMFPPELLRLEGESESGCLNFPPRYKGHEEALARICGATEVRDVGLLAAWSWIKRAFGFGAVAA